MLTDFQCMYQQLRLWMIFWAQGRFYSKQKCWGAAIPLAHVQKKSAAQQQNGLFCFASNEQWHWVCPAHIWVLRVLCLGRLLPGADGCSERWVQPCILLQQMMLSTASLNLSAVGSVVCGIPRHQPHEVVSVLR